MILITRPEKQARELEIILNNKGYECVIEPMMAIKHLQPDWPSIMHEPVQYFITTSKNAKRAVPYGKPLATIPDQGKNAMELYDWIRKNLSPEKGKLVYLRGDIISFDMAGFLKKLGFNVQEALAYQSIPHTDLTDRFVKSFNDLKMATFFSSKTADTFLRLIDKYKLNSHLKKMKLLCISAEVARGLSGYKKNIYIAETPDLAGMINLIDDVY